MSAHTSERWRLDGRLVYALRDSGRGPENAFSASVMAGRGVRDSEAEANARLIASAPDLLAACERALSALNDGGAEFVEYHADDLAAIRAAIAKATGGGK